MWIELVQAAGGLLFSIITIVMGVAAFVRWIVDNRVNTVLAKLDEHEEQHRRERKQVAAAMERNGMTPPDGWTSKVGAQGGR